MGSGLHIIGAHTNKWTQTCIQWRIQGGPWGPWPPLGLPGGTIPDVTDGSLIPEVPQGSTIQKVYRDRAPFSRSPGGPISVPQVGRGYYFRGLRGHHPEVSGGTISSSPGAPSRGLRGTIPMSEGAPSQGSVAPFRDSGGTITKSAGHYHEV